MLILGNALEWLALQPPDPIFYPECLPDLLGPPSERPSSLDGEGSERKR
jgi:hypothetical protein